MNIFTNNSYYTNIILFNFLFLFGLVALFRLFYNLFPQKKYFIITGIFLLPSTLFWCSGIHKDGLILSATGITVYLLHQLFDKKFSLVRIIVALLCILLVFSLRNFVIFALLASCVYWFLCCQYTQKKFQILLLFYSTGTLLFFIIPLVFPSLNFPLFVVGKREEFLLLPGGSEVTTQQLKASITSFISFLPNALDMAFLRPHLNEIKNPSYLLAAIEVLLLIVLVLYSLFRIQKNEKIPCVIVCLFTFSFSIMLLAGYTIPFTGAIVRYRSFALPFLITPLLCISNNAIFRKKPPYSI